MNRNNPFQPPGLQKTLVELADEVRLSGRVLGYDPDDRPEPPVDLVLTISVREVKTRLEYKAKASCDPLTPNTCQADIDKYIFQMRYTNAAGNPVVADIDIRTKRIDAKEVFDAAEPSPHVVFENIIKPRTYYIQVRARIVDKDHRKSDWTAWTDPQLPVDAALPKPPAPTITDVDYDTKEKGLHLKWRGLVYYTEATDWDVPGGDNEPDMAEVVLQWQKSNDGSGRDGPTRTITRPAKGAETDSEDDLVIVVDRIRKRYYYRFRMRSIDRWNRRGDFGSWTAWSKPDADLPPDPKSVTIYEDSKDTVALDWDADDDADDPDTISDDIDFYQVEVNTSSDFGLATRYHFDRRVNLSKFALPIKKGDRDLTFFARVRALDSEKDKSAWVPARIVPNSNPNASPDGIQLLRDEITITFTLPSPLTVGHFDRLWTAPRAYRFRRVKVRFGRHDSATHPADGCPTGSAAILQVFWHDEEETTQDKLFSNDNRLTVQANTHKDIGWAEDMTRTTMAKNEHLSVKCTQIGSTIAGSGGVVQVVMVPD